MNEEILINLTPQETRVALVQQGAVQELHVERTLSRGRVGNIYLGKVVRVLPGMQSAFIDIGLERAAFLHVADIWHPRLAGEPQSGAPHQPIEKIVFEGQTLMVQVIKDPIGTKGARLSTQVSIAGRTLVYLPQEPHIGISQKIESEAEREAVRARLTAVIPPDEKGGYIVRTIAEDATSDELAGDVAYLRKTWATIVAQAQRLPATSLLYQDLDLAQRVLRDFANDDTTRIQVDSRETYQRLSEFAGEFTPAVSPKLHHYTGERPLFDLYNIETEIQRALSRRVDLKSGGYLMIDQTEAMTTIDVNTGGYVGARNFDDTIFKTNLEAAHTIARQLRLRNLGGIIIIDFIDMENAEHRDAVLSELKKALSRDRTRVTVNSFSQLGLVEMTRKRTRESLAHVLCEPCPTCQGKGQVKTSRTVCYDILREILRESRQFNPREFRVIAAQQVIDLFLDEESQHLAMLIDFIGKPVSLQVESNLSQEQYDIVLM
ncbi:MULTISPECIES: ribonuclease G [Burkholderia]|mgnify:FL=1|uniref:Ribonuclease G n=1 Tax=Burkholderia sola TaxID=2843302 RepID=A0ABV2CD45_9BURK|nr:MULTISPECIES: ribonuclease G [Burkholderia]KWU25496.1 ribonuclease [Burkholderia cenocepacia]MBP0609080.1 ribonuclease G [Burkholderia sp. CpTa8-5]MBR8238593.1 ribonuclease G [Burkholderia sp. AU32357]MBY4875662.1 ribonuclease G [Burkholderia sp. AU42008]MDF3085174.1 ribonuclease G [Burkholderia sola]